MTNINVKAEKVGVVYNVPIQIGMDYLDAKFDTGSSVTVISAAVFYDGWSNVEIAKLEKFCEDKGCKKREFKSASDHKIAGYPVVAKNVLVGENCFQEFKYYLVTNGRREMSLLGDDFIDNCRHTHEPHDDIQITGFDFDGYCDDNDNCLESDEVLEFIDELICL